MLDMIKKGTRHFATYSRHTVMILGYAAPSNTVYLINPALMPGDEAEELLRIAVGPTAQGADTMAMVLKDITHQKSGQPWLTHLWNNKGWMGTTFPDNLTDMDQDQKNFFKGFGKSLNPETAKPEETHHVLRTPEVVAESIPVSPIAEEELNDLGGEEMGGPSDTSALEEKLDKIGDVLLMLARNLEKNTAEVNRALKRVPKSSGRGPGRPPKDASKPRIVTGRPTPDSVFSAPEIVQG